MGTPLDFNNTGLGNTMPVNPNPTLNPVPTTPNTNQPTYGSGSPVTPNLQPVDPSTPVMPNEPIQTLRTSASNSTPVNADPNTMTNTPTAMNIPSLDQVANTPSTPTEPQNIVPNIPTLQNEAINEAPSSVPYTVVPDTGTKSDNISTGMQDFPTAPVEIDHLANIPPVVTAPVPDTSNFSAPVANANPNPPMMERNNIPVETLPNNLNTLNSLPTGDLSNQNSQPVASSPSPVEPGVTPLTEEVIPGVQAVSYEEVNTGLNKVVKEQEAVKTDESENASPVSETGSGPSLDDLIKNSSVDAGINEYSEISTEPAPIKMDTNLNSNTLSPGAVVNTVNTSETISNIVPEQIVPPVMNVNAELKPEVPTVQTNPVQQMNPEPVVTLETGPAFSQPVVAPTFNTLPPLENEALNQNPKKGSKSMSFMIVMIIVFFLVGVVLLVVGLYLSNSFTLPFEIPILDSLFGGLK